MTQEVYKQMLETMHKRGGAYAGMDIPEFYVMVEEMFTPREAEINNALPRGPVTAQEMAQTMGGDVAEVGEILEAMADKGLCLAINSEGKTFYQSLRFMPGSLELQFLPGKTTERDKRLAKVIQAYKKAFDVKSPPTEPAFSGARVITVDRTVEVQDTVHTYDQVQTYIDRNDTISVGSCYCRHAAVLRDEDIHGMPIDVCMQFGPSAQFSIDRLGTRQVTKAEAREVLDRAEEAGLIHTSMNMAEGVDFICNCDRWHCVPVTQALSLTKPSSLLSSGFTPAFAPGNCTACETCIDRCPPEALILGDDDVPVLDTDRCFGCAVCATGCDYEAIAMERIPGFAEPPKDSKAMRAAIKVSISI